MICEIQFLFTQCQLTLVIELQWRIVRREDEYSARMYFTNLIDEGNLELLQYELSPNPSHVKYFKEIWFLVLDKRGNLSD